ncbi:MAG: hypothetical protein Hyperionvirus2_134 [Hyperionvirus sp.]|uniref:Uncharacterized protein n=1 Tax=Hyperionvirus sp. TaxID=2487770 RepID=A0A3G5A686_9VIRU|nr:MAG: hypothetical protein Hyperionvirus2_134 [Hyperionvirus sp.]
MPNRCRESSKSNNYVSAAEIMDKCTNNNLLCKEVDFYKTNNKCCKSNDPPLIVTKETFSGSKIGTGVVNFQIETTHYIIDVNAALGLPFIDFHFDGPLRKTVNEPEVINIFKVNGARTMLRLFVQQPVTDPETNIPGAQWSTTHAAVPAKDNHGPINFTYDQKNSIFSLKLQDIPLIPLI